MKLLRGGGRLDAQGRRLCPGCYRQVAPGRKHKRRVGSHAGGSTWCSGVAEPNQELALELARSVHVRISDLLMRRDWDGVVALLGKLQVPRVKRGER